MFSVIVGENASGKTLYLDHIYGSSNSIYNRSYAESMLNPIDEILLEKVYPEHEIVRDRILFPYLDPSDMIEVFRILNMMFRKSDILLLDAIDSTVDESDKHILYKTAMMISDYKPVYAVTHDEDITIYADGVYKVEDGKLVELTRPEMLWEIYQDEEMVAV